MVLSAPPSDDVRPQFSLRHLFLAIAAAAVLLGAWRLAEWLAPVAVWCGCVLYSLAFAGRRATQRTVRVADFLWGIFMPLLCLALDPGFLYGEWLRLSDGLRPRHWKHPELMLEGFGPLAYSAVGLQMTVLLIWLVFGATLGRALGLVAGIFAVGSLLAVVIGTFLSPITILGLLVIYGVLGTTPFFTAWTFFRQFWLALDAAEDHLETRELELSLLLGAAFAIAAPLAFAWLVGELLHL